MFSFFKSRMARLGAALIFLGPAGVRASCADGLVVCKNDSERNTVTYFFNQIYEWKISDLWNMKDQCRPQETGVGAPYTSTIEKCGGEPVWIFGNLQHPKHELSAAALSALNNNGINVEEIRRLLLAGRGPAL